MKHPVQKTASLVAGWALTACISGCVTITPTSPSLSWKSLTKSKIQQASFEEKVPEAPADPKNPARLKVAYGRVMEQTGQLAEARKSYQDALELQPKEVDALLGLARLETAAGNVDQAELNLKKAVKIAPNSAQVYFSLGEFYASQSRWSDASEVLTKAMLADPDDTQSRYALAVALAHIGKVDAALPHFIRTVGDAEAHYNVGLILQSEGHLDDAERHFEMAVAKKPELVPAQNWLAHLRQERQEKFASHSAQPPEKSSALVPAGHSQFLERSETHPQTPHTTIAAPRPRNIGQQAEATPSGSEAKRSSYSLFQ